MSPRRAGPSKRGTVVAIDGPAGVGKSTLARGLAAAVGLPYVNTGLMYRAVADLALDRGVDPSDEGGLVGLAADLAFGLSGQGELEIDGRAPRASLTSPQVERIVSEVARHPAVRAELRARQRRLGAGGCVMEGRDIGTVVFPDADVKIFLSAPLGERARRRSRERGGPGGLDSELSRRDALDARTNPLVPAPDAHVLDTTGLGPDEVLAAALALVPGRAGADAGSTG